MNLRLQIYKNSHLEILNSLKKYPAQAGVSKMLSELGFSEVSLTNVLFGTMSIHVARR